MRPAATPHAFAASFELDAAQTAAVDLLTQPDALGVYMWGPVGRGKTWLLDRYFTGVDIDAKKLVHFHNFFADLHSAYFRQRFSIDHAIDEVLGECRLLCFDEFHVHDIGDGTLIARMLDTLFARGTALVVTSNYPPDGLLPNPLFHEKFEPTIEVLKAHLREIRVDGPIDYRSAHAVRRGFAAGTWTVETELENTDTEAISFAELCTAPRSSSDYLALTEGLTIAAYRNCMTPMPSRCNGSAIWSTSCTTVAWRRTFARASISSASARDAPGSISTACSAD